MTKEYTKEERIKLGGAVITMFIAAHYAKEVSHLPLIRHTVKQNINRTLEDLKTVELKYYDKAEKVDEKGLSDQLTGNYMTFVDWLLNEFDFNEFSEFQEIAYAYKLDAKRIKGISDKILIENGATK